MVEVNASFYALPTIETVAAWAERTPPDFRFHVKAHQVISGAPERPAAPSASASQPAGRARREGPHPAAEPGAARRGDRHVARGLRRARRQARGDPRAAPAVRGLGGAPARRARTNPEPSAARPGRGGVPPSLVGGAGERERAAALLAEHDAAWVCVDAPRIEAMSAMPPVVEVTSPALAYVRMHGRNATAWTRGRTSLERSTTSTPTGSSRNGSTRCSPWPSAPRRSPW